MSNHEAMWLGLKRELLYRMNRGDRPVRLEQDVLLIMSQIEVKTGLEDNENAPAGLQPKQSADIKDQIQGTPNGPKCQKKDVLSQLVAFQAQYQELYRSAGLIGIDRHSVHVTEDFFSQHFQEFAIENRDNLQYPFRISAQFDGVEIFCIVEKIPEKNHVV